MSNKVRDARQSGHWWADNELIDIYGPMVGAYGVAVYALLCRYADNKTGEAFPAIGKIAELLATSKPTVIKTLKTLQTAKLIQIKKRYIKGSKERDSNVYVLLNIPKVVKEVYHVVNEVDNSSKGDLPQVVKEIDSKKTNSKKTYLESSVDSESSKQTRDPLFDAIADNWHTAPGQTALLKSLMLGTNKKNTACNFSPPATPEEVAAFVDWYGRKYPRINLPVAPEKLQSHFYAFRKSPNASKRPETRWNPATKTNEEKVGDTWYAKYSQGSNP